MQQYTEYDIGQAIQAVAAGQSLRRAALDWGIPKTTLRNRLMGSESHQAAAEDQQRLSPVQEKRLVDWVLVQEALGLPPSHAQIKDFVGRILATKGDTKPLGKHWMQAFLRRHPNLKTKRARQMDSVRMTGTKWCHSMLDGHKSSELRVKNVIVLDACLLA
jgi:hypothetical protein